MAAEHKDRVGRRIKKARNARGWSQRELAQRLPGKVDGPSVSRWERGITYPEQYLQHLAEVFEVDVAYFLVEEAKPGTPDVIGALRTSEAEDVAELRSRLDELQEAVDRVEGYLQEQASTAVRDRVRRAAQQRRKRRDSQQEGPVVADG